MAQCWDGSNSLDISWMNEWRLGVASYTPDLQIGYFSSFGGGFPGGPSGKVPHANTGDAAEPFHFLSASLQTFLSSELPPSRPSQPSQGPGGEGVCLASLPENI